MRQRYQEEFQALLDLKFAEQVDEREQPRGPVSYLPHKHVVKEESLTTKLRIVFDASAKEKGLLSLNETLHTGPNWTQDMLAVLIRFRTQQIVLLADIEKSFPQIIIREHHRDALRFLWDADGSGRPQTFRLTRNYFGLASSSFILAACVRTLLHWFQEKYPDTVNAVKENYYVDDLATGAPSEEDAMRIYQQTKEIFAHGSFNLRKWMSNSPSLMEAFRENGDGVEKFNRADWYNVLGMQYSPEPDTMKLKASFPSSVPDVVTMRYVLSTIASVFDRIGVVAPLLVPGKLLMQNMWTRRLSWDDPVPDPILADFRIWFNDLKKIESVVIPRRYHHLGDWETRTLHVFADASRYAYGFCCYIVAKTGTACTSTLLLTKSRVAPLKNATIPRLELMAMALAAEAAEYIRKQSHISFNKEHIWTDNSGVYFQATTEHPERLPTFVRNRVQKIQQLTKGMKIHHVPGLLNPADLISRGCNFEEFSKSDWLTGPRFIRESPETWPRLHDQRKLEGQTDTEECTFRSFIVARPTQPMRIQVNFGDSLKAQPLPVAILRFDTCSKWSTYVRAMVRFRRALERMRGRMTKSECARPILLKELRQAEHFIISQVQAECYAQEYRSLAAGSTLHHSSTLRVFVPFITDGLIVLGGRLIASVSELPKHPTILPPKHRIKRLILTDVHERSCHAGPSQVLITARQRF